MKPWRNDVEHIVPVSAKLGRDHEVSVFFRFLSLNKTMGELFSGPVFQIGVFSKLFRGNLKPFRIACNLNEEPSLSLYGTSIPVLIS